MPKNVAKQDNRFDAAVGYIKRCPKLTIPEAMKLANFSVQEQACRAMQMVLRRLLNKMKGGSALSPPSLINASTVGTPASSLSSISGVTGQSSLVSNSTTPKVKRIRSTSSAAQMKRAAVNQTQRTINEAFKRATRMYDRERQNKKGGMSARAVAELVEKDCGVKISARTIQQKVKEGNVGVSPLRRGPKGNIPDRSYQNLCLAYESYVTINQINGTMRNCPSWLSIMLGMMHSG